MGITPVPLFSEEELAAAEKNLGEWAASATRTGVTDTRWAVRTGVPSHEILEAATEMRRRLGI